MAAKRKKEKVGRKFFGGELKPLFEGRMFENLKSSLGLLLKVTKVGSLGCEDGWAQWMEYWLLDQAATGSILAIPKSFISATLMMWRIFNGPDWRVVYIGLSI